MRKCRCPDYGTYLDKIRRSTPTLTVMSRFNFRLVSLTLRTILLDLNEVYVCILCPLIISGETINTALLLYIY